MKALRVSREFEKYWQNCFAGCFPGLEKTNFNLEKNHLISSIHSLVLAD